ncbi:MAG: hypothetical protein Tsb0013_18200 [Phycisphaerales bacterium]
MHRHRTRHLALPIAIVLGAICVLATTPVAEAGPKVRIRSGNSIHIRTTNSCAPAYRSHRTYSYRNHNRRHYDYRHSSHRHRSYNTCKPRYSYSIRIGGSYGRDYCYDRGYRTTYHVPAYTYNYYSYTPVYRTTDGYRAYDRRPSTGTVYTTSSADRYRDWQRTERVTDRPVEPLLPAARSEDLDRYERNLREAADLLGEPYETSAGTGTLEEPPLGSGSTPTTGGEEFAPSRPDELAQAWSALIDGDASRARTLFADAARTMPKKGEARLGYVIASLRDNDRRAAAVSMVRLLESEPQLVRGGALPQSSVILRELERQGEILKAYRDETVSSFENRMLIAMVALLRGDTQEAQEAMRRARSAGAEGVAARNLWRLVGLSDKPLERLAGH